MYYILTLIVSKMLYEKFIPVETHACIELSELYRRTESDAAEDWGAYLEAFRALMLKIPSVKMQGIPLFEWNGVNSSCWKFEEYRIMHNMHAALVLEAKGLYDEKDHRATKEKLSEALQLAKDMLEMDWYRTPYVRAMPEMRVTYRLSKLFATRSLYCYNMYGFKSEMKVVRMAYQLMEVSNKLWKPTANVDFEKKLLAEYYYSRAGVSEEFKDKLSYITASTQLETLNHATELYNETIHLNETVHFETVEPVSCPVLMIEEALKRC